MPEPLDSLMADVEADERSRREWEDHIAKHLQVQGFEAVAKGGGWCGTEVAAMNDAADAAAAASERRTWEAIAKEGAWNVSDDAFSVEEPRTPTRRERLELAKQGGIEVCPSCAMQHAWTDPCFIDEDIWKAVVDIARGAG